MIQMQTYLKVVADNSRLGAYASGCSAAPGRRYANIGDVVGLRSNAAPGGQVKKATWSRWSSSAPKGRAA